MLFYRFCNFITLKTGNSHEYCRIVAKVHSQLRLAIDRFFQSLFFYNSKTLSTVKYNKMKTSVDTHLQNLDHNEHLYSLDKTFLVSRG